MIEGEVSADPLHRLVTDDDFALSLMQYFCEREGAKWEELESQIDSMEVLDNFRVAFWNNLANFLPSQRKELLLKAWEETQKRLSQGYSSVIDLLPSLYESSPEELQSIIEQQEKSSSSNKKRRSGTK